MRRRHFEIGETAVTILCDESFFTVAEESIFRSAGRYPAVHPP